MVCIIAIRYCWTWAGITHWARKEAKWVLVFRGPLSVWSSLEASLQRSVTRDGGGGRWDGSGGSKQWRGALMTHRPAIILSASIYQLLQSLTAWLTRLCNPLYPLHLPLVGTLYLYYLLSKETFFSIWCALCTTQLCRSSAWQTLTYLSQSPHYSLGKYKNLILNGLEISQDFLPMSPRDKLQWLVFTGKVLSEDNLHYICQTSQSMCLHGLGFAKETPVIK